MKSPPTLFVTGGTGFLGGHFLLEARRRRWRLRCLARRAMPRMSGVEWVRGDLAKAGRWESRLRGCDTVVHLASAQLADCERDPVLGSRVIVEGTARLLAASVRAGVKRFVQASTAEAYGTPSRLPAGPRTPLKPQSLYGWFKACADLCALETGRRGALSVALLRFFNIYGRDARGDVPRTVLRLFAEKIVADQPILLHASLKNSRDFIHVRDAARALALAVADDDATGVIPIGTGRETTLLRAARMLARLAKRKLKVDFRPKEGRLRRLSADPQRARKELGFVPKVSLEQGLREVLNAVRHA